MPSDTSKTADNRLHALKMAIKIAQSRTTAEPERSAFLLHGEWEPVLTIGGRAIEWSGRFFPRRADAMAFHLTWFPKRSAENHG